MSKYEEGTPEYEAYKVGVEDERNRLLKVIEKYHRTFCSGDLSDHDCAKTMQIKYLYDYAVEARSLK